MGEDWNKILYRGVEIPTEMLHIGSRLVQGLIASKLLTYKTINTPFTMTMAGNATPVALHCVTYKTINTPFMMAMAGDATPVALHCVTRAWWCFWQVLFCRYWICKQISTSCISILVSKPEIAEIIYSISKMLILILALTCMSWSFSINCKIYVN